MTNFFANFVGEALAPWVTGLAFAIAALVAIVIAMAIFRRVRQGVFVSGGRKHRLQIVDAAAVDDRRRIVLVRRDDVEHLVMIGGGNDFVIERGIGDTTPPQAIYQQPPVPLEAPSPVAAPMPEPTPSLDTEQQRQAAPVTAAAPAVLAAGAGVVAAGAAAASQHVDEPAADPLPEPVEAMMPEDLDLDDPSLDDLVSELENIGADLDSGEAELEAPSLQAVKERAPEPVLIEEPPAPFEPEPEPEPAYAPEIAETDARFDAPEAMMAEEADEPAPTVEIADIDTHTQFAAPSVDGDVHVVSDQDILDEAEAFGMNEEEMLEAFALEQRAAAEAEAQALAQTQQQVISPVQSPVEDIAPPRQAPSDIPQMPRPKAAESSLEGEMERLLSELTVQR